MLFFLAEVKQNATRKTLTPPPPLISNGVSLIQNNLFICIYLNLHFGIPENVLCDGLLSLLCSHIILLTYIDLKIN